MRPTAAKTLSAAALTLAIAAVALAQAPPAMPPPPPGGPGPALVMAPEVQEDLGVTAKQKDQIARVEASTRQRRRQALAAAAEEGPDPRAIGAAMAAIDREQDGAIARVLDKAQKARLGQIELRREGLLAVARKDVAARLKLTSAQSKKVKAVVDEIRQARARLMPRPPAPPGGPGAVAPGVSLEGELTGEVLTADGVVPGAAFAPPPNFDTPEFRAQMAKAREAIEKLRAEAAPKIEAILTREQKAAFEAMLGKPFDLAKIRPGAEAGAVPPRP